MTTVINTPGNNDSSGGTGALVGIIFLIVFVVLFFVYILPAIRGVNTAPKNPGVNVNLTLPAGNDNSAPANSQPAQ